MGEKEGEENVARERGAGKGRSESESESESKLSFLVVLILILLSLSPLLTSSGDVDDGSCHDRRVSCEQLGKKKNIKTHVKVAHRALLVLINQSINQLITLFFLSYATGFSLTSYQSPSGITSHLQSVSIQLFSTNIKQRKIH